MCNVRFLEKNEGKIKVESLWAVNCISFALYSAIPLRAIQIQLSTKPPS